MRSTTILVATLATTLASPLATRADQCNVAPTAQVTRTIKAIASLSVPTARDCQAACAANFACKSFVFGLPASKSAPVCLLFNVPAAKVPPQEFSELHAFDKACPASKVPSDRPTKDVSHGKAPKLVIRGGASYSEGEGNVETKPSPTIEAKKDSKAVPTPATPEVKTAPKESPEAKTVPKVSPEVKPAPKASPTPVAPKAKTAPKETPEVKPIPKASPSPAAPEVKASPKASPAAKPIPKASPEVKPAPKASPTPAAPEVKTAPKASPEVKPSPKASPEVKPVPKASPEVKPSPKASPTPAAPKVDISPKAKPTTLVPKIKPSVKAAPTNADYEFNTEPTPVAKKEKGKTSNDEKTDADC